MTNKEAVIEILNHYGCCTAQQVVNLARRDLAVVMTPSQVSGILRPLYSAGKVAKDKNENGKTVYWPSEGKLISL